MKSLKSTWGLVALLAFSLVACKGKDPGAGKYSNQALANQKYTGAIPAATTPPTPPPPPNNTQQICTQPFAVSIIPDSGSNMMKFTENTQSSVTLHVRSFMGTDFTVASENLDPTLSSDFAAGRASLKLTAPKDPTSSEADYTFIWKPAKLNFSSADLHTLTLRYTSTAAQSCGQDINTTLNIVVVPQIQPPGAGQ